MKVNEISIVFVEYDKDSCCKVQSSEPFVVDFCSCLLEAGSNLVLQKWDDDIRDFLVVFKEFDIRVLHVYHSLDSLTVGYCKR